MNIETLFSNKKLDSTIFIGYYGGGNYGDELLLEILLSYVKKYQTKDINVLYLKERIIFEKYHGETNVNLITPKIKIKNIITYIKAKNIVIGGGGLWGLDANYKIVMLSAFLLISKYFFFKQIYLLGVGYYNSTNFYGHLGAFLSSLAANQIFARDLETYNNFSKFTNRNVINDKDLALYMLDDHGIDYYWKKKSNKTQCEESIIIITLRKISSSRTKKYYKFINDLIDAYSNFNFEIWLLEPQEYDDYNSNLMKILKKKYGAKVTLRFYESNPYHVLSELNLRKPEFVVSLQYHFIISSYITGQKLIPISYDNKVKEFYKSIGVESVNIEDISINHIEI